MSTNWAKALLAGTDKMLDILNVGRLVFYTAGGFLAIYPLGLTMHLLVTEKDRTTIFKSLADAAKSINNEWLLLFASVVAGFVIAKVGFTTIISPVFKEARDSLQDFNPHEFKYSFNYRYAQLRNDDDEEDYQAWLVREYFRYVEIATFVPMGGALGLILLGIYTAIYLLTIGVFMSAADIYPALVFFLLIAITVNILLYHVWPRFWLPRVIKPTMRTYIRAKISLIEGLEKYKEEQSERAKKIS